MSDIPIREMKGHDILAVERFRDSTCRMIEFVVRKQGNPYGSPGDEMRLFLSEAGYRRALESQNRREIRIKRTAHIIEGHILYDRKKNKKPCQRLHLQCQLEAQAGGVQPEVSTVVPVGAQHAGGQRDLCVG